MRQLAVILLSLSACGGNPVATDAAAGDPDGVTGDASPDANPVCPNPGGVPPIRAQRVTTDPLTQPLFVAQPHGSTDLYVVEKRGRIKIVRAGRVLATPFLDISTEVNIPVANAEGGLLGLEFAPDYAASGRYYIYASVLGDRAKVREYHRSPTNPDVTDPAFAPVELLDFRQDGYNSLGGTIGFGPDGMLWLGAGDGERVPSDAGNLSSRFGKFFRIDPNTPGVAPPNGFPGSPDPFIWDLGVRNPYRWSFDRLTHDLYFGDSGDLRFEEVNIEPPNTGHRDYEWPRYEGPGCADGSSACGAHGTPPAYSLPHGQGFSVIVGGAVYRGADIPCLRGRYIFGVFGLGRILSFVWTGTQVTSEVDLSDNFNDVSLVSPTSFSQDDRNELYVTTFDGGLFKLVPR